jgi:hypothetical protein
MFLIILGVIILIVSFSLAKLDSPVRRFCRGLAYTFCHFYAAWNTDSQP